MSLRNTIQIGYNYDKEVVDKLIDIVKKNDAWYSMDDKIESYGTIFDKDYGGTGFRYFWMLADMARFGMEEGRPGPRGYWLYNDFDVMVVLQEGLTMTLSADQRRIALTVIDKDDEKMEPLSLVGDEVIEWLMEEY